MHNIGEMGHSRGGEGVVQHFVLNKCLGSPYGIKAVLPLAPVDFNRPIVDDVPLSVILPYCDGDVSDLQGIHFYDDALYTSPGDTTAEVHAGGPGREPQLLQHHLDARRLAGRHRRRLELLVAEPHGTAAAERRAGVHGWLLPPLPRWFRWRTGIKPYFDGTHIEPASSEPADTHTSYHAQSADRRDVNNYKVSRGPVDEPARWRGEAEEADAVRPLRR